MAVSGAVVVEAVAHVLISRHAGEVVIAIDVRIALLKKLDKAGHRLALRGYLPRLTLTIVDDVGIFSADGLTCPVRIRVLVPVSRLSELLQPYRAVGQRRVDLVRRVTNDVQLARTQRLVRGLQVADEPALRRELTVEAYVIVL